MAPRTRTQSKARTRVQTRVQTRAQAKAQAKAPEEVEATVQELTPQCQSAKREGKRAVKHVEFEDVSESETSLDSDDEIQDSQEEPDSADDDHEGLDYEMPVENSRPLDDNEDSNVPDEPDSEPKIPEIERIEFMSNKKLWKAGLDATLPPIDNLEEIFDDITRRAMANNFQAFLDHLASRKLRVVTMCSGTESPLLAMEMVGKSLKKLFGHIFEFDHLFSSEIDPFKQAYIERNFQPPVLFRDVKQLTQPTATTAYGAECEVPQNPDILIAGFSCVDFSVLNNKQKSLDDAGESGQTFFAILGYAQLHRPPLVVLENVKNAPWAQIADQWRDIGYLAECKIVDTKHFYLPQTRERGYMVCIDQSRVGNDEDLLRRWSNTFEKFKRQASSPFTSFTLQEDDLRLKKSQISLASRQANTTRAAVDWLKYKIRHQDYRREKGLGHKRPLTNYQDGGTCRPPSWTDKHWFSMQVERVWDTIDMNFLRTLRSSGFDINYKLRIIDLSQGIDREIDGRPWGVAGCITPCGMQYVTTRGGLLTGLESLALQGLPLDRLTLTRESSRELQDLAGNAMSSTVVGSAILAALIVGYGALNTESKPSHVTKKNGDKNSHALEPSGEYQMIARSLTASVDSSDRLSSIILAAAHLASRLCACEEQNFVKRQRVFQCVLCGHTACGECRGNPAHQYLAIDHEKLQRRHHPFKFTDMLKWLLPVRVRMAGTPTQVYHIMQLNDGQSRSDVWAKFMEGISLAYGDELRFSTLKRAEDWTAIYNGRHSMLHLVIGRQGIQWFLYAKPPRSDPSVSIRREIFLRPVARMRVAHDAPSLLEGVWEVCTPLSAKLTLYITGTGDRIPSHEARCGLQGAEFENRKVWRQISVNASDEAVKDLDMDVRGVYDHLPNCGTANESLHRRPARPGLPALYFFLDPRKLGPPELDSFVFSTSHHRLTGDISRQIVLELDHNWRQFKQRSKETPVTGFYRKWVACPDISLQDLNPIEPVVSRILLPTTILDIDTARCHESNIPLLAISAGVDSAKTDLPWEHGPWKPLDMNAENVLHHYSWLWQKFTNMSIFEGWRRIPNAEYVLCDTCAPAKPKMIWKYVGDPGKDRLAPCEDPVDAARYERQFKARPSAFLAFTRVDERGIGHLCLTLNLKTLFHRASAKLAGRPQENSEVQFFWRMKAKEMDLGGSDFGTLRLTNNVEDPESPQPPNFRHRKLRPEQLRSLYWIRTCESDDAPPFGEEEVEEAVLGPLEWRVEAKVVVKRAVRGGVLADVVGFGKTALVLGTIDAQHEKDLQEAEQPCAGAIPIKATLIVVPDILFDQWQSEIKKFLGNAYRVMAISTPRSLFLKTIEAFQKADIIIASWSVFTGTAYYNRLEQISGGASVPGYKQGRIFEDWFHETVHSIESHVDVLRDQGPERFLEEIERKRTTTRSTDAYNRYLPSRREKGQKLANKTAGQESNTGVDDGDPTGREDGTVNETAEFEQGPPKGKRSRAVKATTTKKAKAGKKTGAKKRKRADINTASVEDNNEPKSWDDREDFGISESENTEMGDMKGGIFHMFRFQRVIIDEFTYLETDKHALLSTVKARSRWLLSGTPPINGFTEVNTFARLIDVYLGTDDDTQNLNKHSSDAEIFQSYRKLQSTDWHVRRHGMAQAFLDRFMRQNMPEIPAIPFTVHYHAINLSAVEIALYHELKLYFESCNVRVRRSKQARGSNDQSWRINEVFETSQSFEEALIKRCSLYNALPSWHTSEPLDTLVKVIQRRRRDITALQAAVMKDLKRAVWLFVKLGRCDQNFANLEQSVKSHDFGDAEVTAKASQLLQEALATYRENDWTEFWSKGKPEKSSKKKQEEFDEDDESDEEESLPPKKKTKLSNDPGEETKKTRLPSFPEEKDRGKLLRETATTLRTKIAEWVNQARALRFMETVHRFQVGVNVPACSRCGREHGVSGIHNILGKCGHVVCNQCVEAVVKAEECPVNQCRGAVSPSYIINGRYFGRHKDQAPVSSYGGTKMKELVNLLQDTTRIPREDRVILFVQFEEFRQRAQEALEANQIPYVAIGASEKNVRKKIKAFTTEGNSKAEDAKVLILMLGSENAAGINLQMANHVIFLAEMCAATAYDHESSMTQAIGRALRYGQRKHVHVWHILALNTIDIAMLQSRTGLILVRRPDGEFTLVRRDQIQRGDLFGWDLPDLTKSNQSFLR